MAACSGYDTYRSNHFEGMDPKRLILMLYDGALKHMRIAKEGVDEGNIQKRGENLGRAIAIVSELNACLDTSIEDESVEFLRGLYAAILTELPKVSIKNDVQILDRSYSYISKLKEIWEKDVMGTPETKVVSAPVAANSLPEKAMPGNTFSNKQVAGYHGYTGKSTSISV